MGFVVFDENALWYTARQSLILFEPDLLAYGLDLTNRRLRRYTRRVRTGRLEYKGMAFWNYEPWVQYLSSDSESDGDDGYHPRDGEPGGAPGPGDVGGGTPWEPPLPVNSLQRQIPCIITWNGIDEERLPGYRDYSGPVKTDYPEWKSVPICLYNRKVTATNTTTVVVGERWGDTFNDFDRNWNTFWDGNTGLGLRMPYYWDGVSAKPDPEIIIELPYKVSGSFNSTTRFKVKTWDLSSTLLDQSMAVGIGTGRLGPWVVTLTDAAQLATFTAGWNEFKFRIGRDGNNSLGYTFPRYGGTFDFGFNFMITACQTSMPLDHNFELKVQQNWASYFNAKVLKNGTLLDGTDNGNDSVRSWVGPNGHRTASNIGYIYDTTITWDVYSANPADLEDYWWEFPLRTSLPTCVESQMRILLSLESDIGPSGGGTTLVNENYCKMESYRVNTAPPGGNRQYKGKYEGAIGLTWVPATHMQLNRDINWHWYIPYNCKALIWLKRGTENSDILA